MTDMLMAGGFELRADQAVRARGGTFRVGGAAHLDGARLPERPGYTISQVLDITSAGARRSRSDRAAGSSPRRRSWLRREAGSGTPRPARPSARTSCFASSAGIRARSSRPWRPSSNSSRPISVNASPETIEAALEACAPFRFETPIVRADGTTRIVESYGEVLEVVDGKPVKIVGTVQDMTERRQVEEELVLRREAEREYKARSEFLSRISHELRTPMNSILGFAQLLEMDDLTEAQHENVELISKGGHHLLQLINEVLEISRIESGNLTVSVEPVNVEDTVAEVMDLVRPLAAEHGVALENQLGADGDHHVAADHQRLKQVLLNLLSNGIKYNRRGGSVRISVGAPSPERLLILVTDTGHGIPEDKLAHVSARSTGWAQSRRRSRARASAWRSPSVSSRRWAGRWGWRASPAWAVPSCVGLAAADASAAAQDRLGEFAPGTANGAAGPRRCSTSRTTSPTSSSSRRSSNARGGSPAPDRDGGAARPPARSPAPPDLILLDLHLPGHGRGGAAAQAERRSHHRGIPVLVVSADATSARVERVLTAGARAFVTKPIDVKRFMALVDDALREKVGV